MVGDEVISFCSIFKFRDWKGPYQVNIRLVLYLFPWSKVNANKQATVIETNTNGNTYQIYLEITEKYTV